MSGAIARGGLWIGCMGYLAAGCSQPVDAPAVHYVGALESGDVMVAVVLNADRATAYLCGQGGTLDTHTRWYGGVAAPDGFTLTTGEWTLSATHTADALVGELVGPSEQRVPFMARALPDDPAVGLFSASVGGCRAGAIVWSPEQGDGGDCRVRGAVCESDDGVHKSQVTPVDCPLDGELHAVATRMGAAVSFDLERMEAPLAPGPVGP